MDGIKKIITGTVITLIIGGTAYSISQTDVVNNFANETGLTQEQAEQYVNSIPEEELAPWNEIGDGFINEGKELLDVANDIDCINYEYKWESYTLTCQMGKTQISKLANDSTLLGYSYVKLGSDSASKDDMRKTIQLIDQVNLDYQFEVVSNLIDSSTIEETKKTNLYNKSLLKTVVESET